MSLKEHIQNDIKAALLGGDRFTADTLRGLKAAILNEEVANNKRDEGLSDTEVEKVVAREVKKRQESIKLYTENGRPELAENEENEVKVLEAYLPEQMSEAELSQIVQDVINGMGGASTQQMGQVIGAVKGRAGNSADGATIAKLVKDALNN